MRNLTKEDTEKIICGVTYQAPKYIGSVVDDIKKNLNILSGIKECENEYQNDGAKFIRNMLGNELKDATYSETINIIAHKWNDLDKSQKYFIATFLGGIRAVNEMIAFFDEYKPEN